MKDKLFVCLAALVILGGVIITLHRLDALSGEPAITAIHTVSVDETLWSISKLYSPDADPRKVIYWIRENNRLDSAIIQPWQELIVPIDWN